METMLIQLNHQKAASLLHELEEMNIIKVLKESNNNTTQKLSEKYKGILNKEEADSLNQHIKQMRSEWNSL